MPLLELSFAAQGDLEEVLDMLAIEAGTAVEADFARRFDLLFDVIADFPGIGAPRPQYGADIRMSVVYPYVVLYRTSLQRTLVLRILHGRRRITRKLVREGGS